MFSIGPVTLRRRGDRQRLEQAAAVVQERIVDHLQRLDIDANPVRRSDAGGGQQLGGYLPAGPAGAFLCNQ